MRKVRFLQGLAGNGYTYNAGSEQSLPAELAKRFVDKGYAVYTDDPKPNATPPAKRARKSTRKPSEKR